VAEGQEIAEDDPLVDIQTDKATVEIPSPYSGTILRIVVGEGEIAPVGAVLVVIGAPGEEPEVLPSPPVSEGHDRGQTPGPVPSGRMGLEGKVAATPLVRKVAQELGVDLATVSGSGTSGRITEADVRSAAASDTSGGPSGGPTPEGRREPLRGVRRVIAEHMARAHREVPAVTWVEECDFEDVDLQRLVATLVKACAESLAAFPELNARLEGEEIVLLERYDIGVAVQTEEGLLVPVVRACDGKTVDELQAEIERLADGARSGTLAPTELRGSTFTVTSAGKLGGLFQTPIVNHPEVAILSVGRIAPRAVVRDGEVVVRRTGSIAVTFDHRVVDGARAAAFGLDVIARIEDRIS
jgi:pyruvate dehydrogenase E2 component (dihydrolipoyllysine-residue acetyltransferase)